MQTLSATARLAQRYGFKLLRKRKHAIWMHPNGACVVTGVSASDHRALRNQEMRFRKGAKQHLSA